MPMIINKTNKGVQAQSHREPGENWEGGDWISVPEELEAKAIESAPWCELVIEDGVLVEITPLPKPEPEPLPPTEGERLEALEQAMIAVMEGGAANV